MDDVLHALADGNRRVLLEVLRDHPATAGELAEALPIARPGVSRHLRVLRDTGLVEVHQQPQRRIHSLSPAPLAEIDAWLAAYRALWRNRLDARHTEAARNKRQHRSRRSSGRPRSCEPCDPPRHLLLTIKPDTEDETKIEAWLTTQGANARLVVEERGLRLAQLHFHGAGWVGTMGRIPADVATPTRSWRLQCGTDDGGAAGSRQRSSSGICS